MSRYQTETDKAITRWKLQTLFGLFKPRLILIPFSIINRIHEIPNTEARFAYKEVFVFGVRVMRFQMGM
jgi:hypothetical protein